MRFTRPPGYQARGSPAELISKLLMDGLEPLRTGIILWVINHLRTNVLNFRHNILHLDLGSLLCRLHIDIKLQPLMARTHSPPHDKPPNNWSLEFSQSIKICFLIKAKHLPWISDDARKPKVLSYELPRKIMVLGAFPSTQCQMRVDSEDSRCKNPKNEQNSTTNPMKSWLASVRKYGSYILLVGKNSPQTSLGSLVRR